MITALAIFLVVFTIAFYLHPILTTLVFIGLIAAAVAWAWDRTTEGHHYSWLHRGSTFTERLHARFRGAPVGHWDNDGTVMAHYPHVVAERARRAREAAAAASAAGEPIEGVVVHSNRQIRGAA